ncbi:MAG: hypothetical protein WA117_08515 [Verrucomicrobiia bacterium]
MKCYNHSEIDAVGVCMSCGRALCHDCIAEVGLRCSCKGRCEATVANFNDYAERAKTVYQKSSAVYRWMGIFALMFGILFAGYGGVSFFLYEPARALFPLLCGLILIGAGVGCMVAARQCLQK